MGYGDKSHGAGSGGAGSAATMENSPCSSKKYQG